MSRWWFQRFFIFTPIWGRFPFWLIFFKWVETTTKMSYFHSKWVHTSTKVKYTPWNPLTFPKNRENFSYWTKQVIGGFEFEGSRFSIFWRGTLQETNMSHLAKRKIIFKCAFFRGDVSSQEGRFSAVLGTQNNETRSDKGWLSSREAPKPARNPETYLKHQFFFEDMLGTKHL